MVDRTTQVYAEQFAEATGLKVVAEDVTIFGDGFSVYIYEELTGDQVVEACDKLAAAYSWHVDMLGPPPDPIATGSFLRLAEVYTDNAHRPLAS